MKVDYKLLLGRTQKQLQTRAFENYRTLLLMLCRQHSDFEYTSEIRSLLLGEQIDDLLDLADSLSSQMYEDATTHFVANQFALLIKKYPFPKGSNKHDPEAKAFEKFEASEHSCKRANQRLRAWRGRKAKPRPFDSEITAMRDFIRYVIGEEIPYSEIWSQCGFGKGASLGVHGNATHAARKLLATEWTVSPGAHDYAIAAVLSHAQFREVICPEKHTQVTSGTASLKFERAGIAARVKLVSHNNISFVPKTVKTHRSIAVEPLLNGFVQKGVDLALRLRLKRIGIDLQDQEPNRQMAREGSYDDVDGFCTIDLSSASDSIATEVCRTLLPYDWFYMLDSIRSRKYNYRGVISPFEKFCSMGNGFCFPLETLLFTAACHAVKAGRPGIDFRVYGDDIIVRKQFYEPVVALLNYLGFAVNREKTFSQGPFRESCGADWFGGKDVRPFTLDFALDSSQSIYKILNLTLRNSRTTAFFEETRAFLLRLLPKELRFFRPYHGPADTAITSIGSEFMTTDSPCCFNKQTRCWEWLELLALPVADTEWRVASRKSNSTALVFGALSGSASACPFPLRNTSRAKVRLTSHPGAQSNWLPARLGDTDEPLTACIASYFEDM